MHNAIDCQMFQPKTFEASRLVEQHRPVSHLYTFRFPAVSEILSETHIFETQQYFLTALQAMQHY